MSRTIGTDLAFPILDRGNIKGGITKREEFAKAAMVGILANCADAANPPIGVARKAVQHADALIEALGIEVA